MPSSAPEDQVPDFSVVVPVFNNRPFLPALLQALYSQNYPRKRFEIVIIDNGSDDGSLEYLAEQSDIKLLTEPRRGSYKARNLGIKAGRGRWIAFTDSDCCPGPDWLARLRACFEEGYSVVIGPSPLPPRQSPALRLVYFYEHGKERFVYNHSDSRLYFGHTSNMAVTRSAINQCGPFVELDRGSDTLLVRRIADSRGVEAIYYCSELACRHLEVRTLAHYFSKRFIYGSSLQTYSKVYPCRALGFLERLEVWTKVSIDHGLSVVDRLLLLMLLVMGWASWCGGRFKAFVEERE